MTEVISSFNPNTQDVVGTVSITPIESISDILQKSVSAQKKWGQYWVKERAGILKQVRKQLVKKSDELISLISEETGKPFWDSFLETMTVAELLKYMCGQAPYILSKEKRSPGIFIHKRT